MAAVGIPEDFDPAIVETIQGRLNSVEAAEDVSLIAAVESGSRAWGFPSPDSDYDCRFIYRQRPDRYLSLWPERDVIETPLDEIYDVNGWDVAKALRLLVKGNAVAIEWLTSPISYRTDPAPQRILTEFARRHADPIGVRRHYFHLATNQIQRHLIPTDQWQAKALFYALRPVAALRWLRLHTTEVLLPMNFWDLMAEAEVDGGIVQLARRYAELKASMPEHHLIAADVRVLAFVEEELSQANLFDPNLDAGLASRKLAADNAFRDILDLPWPSTED